MCERHHIFAIARGGVLIFLDMLSVGRDAAVRQSPDFWLLVTSQDVVVVAATSAGRDAGNGPPVQT